VSSENKDGESRAWTRALRDMGPYLGIGASLAVTVLGGVGIGHWLDGAVVGIAAAGYHFYRLVRVKR
jgi:hypothetical protein